MIKYPNLQDKKWLKGELKNRTIRNIAAELGCSYSAIQAAIKKFGLGVPHRSKYTITEAKSIAQKNAYKKKYPNGRFGENASRWQGGRQAFKGYIRIFTPEHPNATSSNPYIFEHRLVAEKMLGRYLTRKEVVHHINGNKQDNRPENLEVTTRSKHVHSHYTKGEGIQALYKRIQYLEGLLDAQDIRYKK